MLDSFVNKYGALIGTRPACKLFGVNQRSWRHRKQCVEGRLKKRASADSGVVRKAHPSTMSHDERQYVLNLLCSEKYCDVSPTQIYWNLLDRGTYLCSARQMYRILSDQELTGDRRGRHSTKHRHKKPRLVAKSPDRVWCWDITILRGPTKGIKYYLYTFIDLFSRKIVAWSLHVHESESHARKIIGQACTANGIEQEQLIIHADRGSAMIAGNVEELLHDLGVSKSHSRPHVSNDNAYMESHYKTLKYQPDYPERFNSIHQARQWCRKFFYWYNECHYHQGIGYQHPSDVHSGKHKEVTARRQQTLNEAYKKHPHRFSKPPTSPSVPEEVWINRPVREVISK